MTGFWISAAAMVLMVALVLVQALRQGRATAAMAAGTHDLAVYRDQLAEVERDLTRGTLAPAEADRLRVEVQRRMLDADKTRREQSAAVPHHSGGVVVIVAVVVVVLLAQAGAAGLYWTLGVPGYPDLPLSNRLALADQAYASRPSQLQAEADQPPFAQPADLDPAFADMLDKLRSAVASRPDDLLGHTLLAQNEASLGNFVAARMAQETVVRLKDKATTAEDLSLLAYVMIRAAGGLVTPEAEKVLIACLQLDPRNGWARFYSGLMFAEIGRPDRTFALWQPLLAESPADAPWSAPIRDQLADIAAAAGINYTPETTAPGPDAAAVAAAADMTDADRQTMIRTMVAGLEQRLMADGGPVQDWARLITSLGVLQERDHAQVVYVAAKAVFAGKPGELAALQAAAVQAGLPE